jgi:hypothetical protein
MGTVTTLYKLLSEIETLDQDASIYARKPWTLDSHAILVDSMKTTTEPIGDFEYLLDVGVVVETFENVKFQSLDSKCERLIRYAITDA